MRRNNENFLRASSMILYDLVEAYRDRLNLNKKYWMSCMVIKNTKTYNDIVNYSISYNLIEKNVITRKLGNRYSRCINFIPKNKPNWFDKETAFCLFNFHRADSFEDKVAYLKSYYSIRSSKFNECPDLFGISRSSFFKFKKELKNSGVIVVKTRQKNGNRKGRRVNISRDEYEALKEKVNQLTHDNDSLQESIDNLERQTSNMGE